MKAMTEMLDRVEPGYFECDEEGYWQASEDEVGPDGKAIGIEFCLYIYLPETTLEWNCQPEGTWDLKLSDEEMQEFVPWVQKEYPAFDWNFDADEYATASLFGEYQEGEDTEALMMRCCVNNPDYNRLRNEWCIYYTGLNKFLDNIHEVRRKGKEST